MNYISLSSVQVFSYLFPVITTPYLVRVIGANKYGLLAFAGSLNGFFNLLIEFSFRFSATRRIAVVREDKKAVSRIMTSVMMLKLLGGIITMAALILLVNYVTRFHESSVPFLLSYGYVIGNAIFPLFVFQGIEKMKYVAIYNFISRVLFTVLLFVVIRAESDYIYVPLLNLFGSIVISFLSFWELSRLGIGFCRVSLRDIMHELKDGYQIFVSNVAISLYTTLNTFLLGMLTSNIYVGYYAAAEKITKLIQNIYVPFFNSLYPNVSRRVGEQGRSALQYIFFMTKLVSGAMLLISILTFSFAPIIVKIFLGNGFLPAITTLRVLSFLPFIISVSNMLGIQIMYNFEMKKTLSAIVIVAAVIGVLSNIVLIPLLKHNGVALSWFLTETFVTIVVVVILRKRKFFDLTEDLS